MKFHPTPIAGLFEIETLPHGDARGSLTRLYCAAAFDEVAPGLRFVQVNHSITRSRGTLRGLHYQHSPALEAKLIRCMRGRVFDVAVDLRAGSPTFARWHAVELSADNQRQILIPPGCAHGFQTLADDCQLLYQHSAAYTPACEAGLRFDDPRLAIAWPEAVTEMSARDRGFAPMGDRFEGLRA
ncbi:MAG: dTDP-4-dehydrorhamnose 3,5-epimerase [Burkholderiales bacterium]